MLVAGQAVGEAVDPGGVRRGRSRPRSAAPTRRRASGVAAGITETVSGRDRRVGLAVLADPHRLPTVAAQRRGALQGRLRARRSPSVCLVRSEPEPPGADPWTQGSPAVLRSDGPACRRVPARRALRCTAQARRGSVARPVRREAVISTGIKPATAGPTPRTSSPRTTSLADRARPGAGGRGGARRRPARRRCAAPARRDASDAGTSSRSAPAPASPACGCCAACGPTACSPASTSRPSTSGWPGRRSPRPASRTSASGSSPAGRSRCCRGSPTARTTSCSATGTRASTPTTSSEALRLLRPGGVVAFDNALWHDRVADPAQRDPETVAIRELGRRVREDERLVTALLPVGDGLLVAVKR